MMEPNAKKQWREYLAECEQNNYSLQQVKKHLKSKGFDQETIRAALVDYSQYKNRKKLLPVLAAIAVVAVLGIFLIYQPSQPTGHVTISATPYPLITINYANTIGIIHPNFYGIHVGSWGGNASLIDTNNDGSLDSSSNYQAHRTALLGSKANYIRRDMYLNNVINPDGTFNRQTYSNGGNINNAKSQVIWAHQNGFKVLFETTFMPRWLANNASTCSYGAVGTTFTSCEPSNYTKWGQIVVAFLQEAGCSNYPGVCEVEVWNEPYLPQFWQSNGTCQDRIQAYLRMYDATYNAVKAAYPTMKVGGPSGYYGISCGVNLTNAFLAAVPPSRVDFVSFHQYSDINLAMNLNNSVNNIRALGHGNDIKVTEYGAGTAAVEVNQSLNHTLYLASGLVKAIKLEDISSMVLFEWANDNRWSDGPPNYAEWPHRRSMFAEPAFENTVFVPYTVTRTMATYHQPGNTIATSGDTSKIFTLGSRNSTNYTFTIGNTNNTAGTVTVVLVGLQAASVRNMNTGAVTPVNGNSVNLTIPAFEVYHYIITEAVPPPPVNTVPTVSVPTLVSADGSNNPTQNIICGAQAFDAESASLTVQIQWYKNSATFGSVISNTYANASPISVLQLPPNLFAPDAWTCSVRVFDGTNYSTWRNATPLTLVAPPPPPPPPVNETNTSNNTSTMQSFPSFVNLQHTANASTRRYTTVTWTTAIYDDNGVWNWNLNTNATGVWTSDPVTFVGGAASTTGSATKTILHPAGSVVCASFTATNAQNNTNTSEESCFSVANTPADSNTPVLTSSLGQNTSDENLQCSVLLSDIDGEEVSLTVDWYKNNQWQSENTYNNTYPNGSTVVSVLSNTFTASGDTWRCDVTSRDAVGNSAAASSNSLIIAAPPDAIAPLITLLSPADEATTSSSSVAFSWLVTDDQSPTTTCMFTVDGVSQGANYTVNNNTTTFENVTSPSAGSHSWQVRCTDLHANTGFSSVYDFTVPAAQSSSSGGSRSGGGGTFRPPQRETSSGSLGSGSESVPPTSGDPVTTTSEPAPPEFTSPTEPTSTEEQVREETPAPEVLQDDVRSKTVFPLAIIVALLGVFGWQVYEQRKLKALVSEEAELTAELETYQSGSVSQADGSINTAPPTELPQNTDTEKKF